MAERPGEQSVAEFEYSLEVALEPQAWDTSEVREGVSELRPKSAKEVGDEYGVSDRVIQDNFKIVQKAYPWIALSNLRVGSSNKTRYTQLCQQLIAEFRASELTPDDWVASIHKRHAEDYESWLQAQIVQPDPLLDEMSSSPESPNPVDRYGMVAYEGKTGEMERFVPKPRKVYRFTSTREFVDTARQNTEEGLDAVQSNSSALATALISQMTEEGRKLGVTLFQAKYGTAHSVLADMEEDLAKKSGLAEEVQPPVAGSAA